MKTIVWIRTRHQRWFRAVAGSALSRPGWFYWVGNYMEKYTKPNDRDNANPVPEIEVGMFLMKIEI